MRALCDNENVSSFFSVNGLERTTHLEVDLVLSFDRGQFVVELARLRLQVLAQAALVGHRLGPDGRLIAAVPPLLVQLQAQALRLLFTLKKKTISRSSHSMQSRPIECWKSYVFAKSPRYKRGKPVHRHLIGFPVLNDVILSL